jgi:alpha-galactosidase
MLSVAPPSAAPPPPAPEPPAASPHVAPIAPSPRPPLLGWSSWSHYHRDVRESDIKAQAEVVAAALMPSGYVYVNVDGGWFVCCDEHGRVKPDPQRFPSGVAALASYVHGKGLKLGLYLHPGLQKEAWDANGTIAGTALHVRDIADTTQPGSTKDELKEPSYRIDFSKRGSAEFIQSYADLLASWGVDYLKLDFIGSGRGRRHIDNKDEVAAWWTAIEKSGRPIWLELSYALDYDFASFWKAHANGWRVTGDIEGNTPEKVWRHVLERFEVAPKWAPFAGPGGWNDFDSLELGNGDAQGLTLDERRTVMTLWAVSCSQLMVGSDLTRMDATDLSMLTNSEVLAVDQAGHVATPVDATQQVWRAANPDGSYTVALFNLGDAPSTVSVSWSQIGLAGPAAVHDMWTHADLGRFEGGFQLSLARHASGLLRVFP